MDIYALLIPGVIIVPDERDVIRIHGLLLGPVGTPYEGGIFRFVLKYPPALPAKPPLVKLLTIDEGRERFAPNPNEDGMISLSLLGTWSGPMWNSSEHNLRTVLIALQSIVTDDPYHNVPALVEDALDPGSSYSPELRNFVFMTFLKSYKAHSRTVGLQMRRMVREGSNPFGVRTTRCDYDFILIRLERLYENVLGLSESTSCDRAVD
ncbi:ubiquitin-conjugating enzyme E2 Z-like [Rhipicephalus microplus]|uniref:ubiquitin-conjugating enzyme E2 Z-like n=1 Tax=Rhipicephalus microplus TaxID=6941 RepID=UPI003F6D7B98